MRRVGIAGALVLAALAGGLAFWLAGPGFAGRFADEGRFAFALANLVPGLGMQARDAVLWLQALSAIGTGLLVLAAYWCCRAALGLSAPASLAAIAPVALHPVLVRHGAALLPDAWSAALALACLGLAARAEVRVAAREAVAPEARLEVPVYGGNAGELLGIAVMPREAPRRSAWERAHVGSWWPVGAAGALAGALIPAAATALAAVAVALALRRRHAELVGLAAGGVAFMAILGTATALIGLLPPLWPSAWQPGALPRAAWLGAGYALPGWLVPQVFLAGYPLGAEAAGPVGRLPQNLLGVWGALVALSVVGPVWKLRLAAGVAAQAAGFFALLIVAGAFLWAAGIPGVTAGDVARLLLPAAPLLCAGLWLWKAGEHRLERTAAERFKDWAALGWVALVLAFSPVALSPVRADHDRFVESLPDQEALLAAVSRLAGPEDRVAAARPAVIALHAGRQAVMLPLGSPDMPAAVRETGAKFVVSDGADETQRAAFIRAAALDPDWARPVYASPDKRFTLFALR